MIQSFYGWAETGALPVPVRLREPAPPKRPGPARQSVPASWVEPTAAWLAWLRAAGITSQTVAFREYQMRRIAAVFAPRGPWELTADDLAGWLGAQTWQRNTRRTFRAALRSFYGWAFDEGLIAGDPAGRLPKVRVPTGKPRPAPDRVIDEALARADDRVRLAILLGADVGLRRVEIAGLHTDCLISEPGGWSLVVHGKGDKTRVVPLPDEIAEMLAALPEGWVFPNGQGSHITPKHMGKIIKRALIDATPHQLRHRFATTVYQATKDIRATQELLGHSSVATTQIYTIQYRKPNSREDFFLHDSVASELHFLKNPECAELLPFLFAIPRGNSGGDNSERAHNSNRAAAAPISTRRN